ncbi:Transposase and inactivated derivatives, IS30 family [Fusobacterium necrophorum subsp. necrophorum]|nr:Transposase and inactivated derivatives, IS30 family [Fusobacterium necrophorum subsp. necrophorum]
MLQKRYTKKISQRKRIRKQGGKSIEQRAQLINNREEIGHFEMDTVVGKRGSSSCLLVLTDRKSRLEVIRKLKSKTVKDVVETVKILLENIQN